MQSRPPDSLKVGRLGKLASEKSRYLSDQSVMLCTLATCSYPTESTLHPSAVSEFAGRDP